MIQETSLDAFVAIQGTLGRSQREVLDALRSQPNATNAEIAWMLRWPINRVTPRIVELRSDDIALVEAFGKRKCRVTGNNAIAWRAVPMPSGRKEEPPKIEQTNQTLF